MTPGVPLAGPWPRLTSTLWRGDGVVTWFRVRFADLDGWVCVTGDQPVTTPRLFAALDRCYTRRLAAGPLTVVERHVLPFGDQPAGVAPADPAGAGPFPGIWPPPVYL